jgi:ATP-dependent Lon protease
LNLNDKIKRVFSNEYIFKSAKNNSIFGSTHIPPFIKDWLIKKFSDDVGNIDTIEIDKFLNNHLPKDGKIVRGKILMGETIKILARIIVEADIKKGIFKFAIPDIGINLNETRIPEYIAKKHSELMYGEIWGVVTLSYNREEKDNFIELVDFKSFAPYKTDLAYFKEARAEFSIEEWIDLLIRAMEYNPDGFNSMGQKITFLTRLLPFVENRVNLIELAPKGTGKSYIFGGLSKFGWLISGGTVTRAKLLYDVSKNSSGVITKYDYIAMDEIQTIKFSDEDEIAGGLKSYLESGTFTIANVRQNSNASFIILGNIDLDEFQQPTVNSYFDPLPNVFKESAFLDRFHGFIKGWNLPRINQSMFLEGNGLNVEYFSEILHALRDENIYSQIVDDFLNIPANADTRDVKAIKRLTTAYLKLFFPHIKSKDEINKNDFNDYCLNGAIEMRGTIRREISKIDREFAKFLPNITTL